MITIWRPFPSKLSDLPCLFIGQPHKHVIFHILRRKTRSKQQAVHPRTPDPYEESSKRQFDGRVKAWRRELHKWDVMDNIAQVAVPPKKKEVECGEITYSITTASTATQQHNYGSWANQVEAPPVLVVAPVLALGNNSHAKSKSAGAKVSQSESGTSSSEPFNPFYGHELDSHTAEDNVRNSGEAIGEDVEALEGVNYDCEAPSDCDEDVL